MQIVCINLVGTIALNPFHARIRLFEIMLKNKALESELVPNIRSEQVAQIYAAVPISLLAIVLNSSVLAYIMWGLVPAWIIVSWLVFTNGFSLLRLAMYFGYKRLDRGKPVPEIWASLTIPVAIVSGLSWGLASFILFPDDIVYQAFLMLVLAGMCAGAISTLSAVLPALVAYIMSVMPLLFIKLLLVGSTIHSFMAFMTFLFTIMVLTAGYRFNATIKDALVTKHRHRKANEVIERQASFDALTGLPNRRMLMARLKQDLSRAARHGHMGAVLFLDLDHFKVINDSLGHSVGDKLLLEVAERLQQRLREEDTAARLGGDEFIIVMSEAGNSEQEAVENAMELSQEIVELFLEPFNINGHELHVTSSIGVVLFPFEDCNVEDLLQKSDVAMYQAKEAGRNKARFFMPEMQYVVDNRRNVEKGLRQALKNDEFIMYYQPLVDVDNRICALEGLVRWDHPERGLLSPNEFIDIAEQSGLIIQLGDWVLKKSCMEVSVLQDESIKVHVNVSPRQFVEANFVDKVKAVVADTAIAPHRICMEITEGMIVSNIESSVQKMKALSALGVSLSIDDFGTGYSSLAYLKQLPVEQLKIDKSFVRDINSDPNDAVIVETIIGMARHMSIDVVAEGVEDQKTFAALVRKGCRLFQGYYFGRPSPLNEIKLRDRNIRIGQG